jgi:hypothetical protein
VVNFINFAFCSGGDYHLSIPPSDTNWNFCLENVPKNAAGEQTDGKTDRKTGEFK